MKKILAAMEILGPFLGIFWLFAPPSWQAINRGVTIALAIVLLIIGLVSLGVSLYLVRDQRKAPYPM